MTAGATAAAGNDPAVGQPRPKRQDQLVAAARRLLDADGPDALTVRRIGAELGIRGPSIYKHFPDKAAIEDAVTVDVLRERAIALHQVPATFEALSHSYRIWALEHPHLHHLIHRRPLNRDFTGGLEFRAVAPLVTACGDDKNLARAAWATITGLVDLELTQRFPPGTDIAAIYQAANRAYGHAAQP